MSDEIELTEEKEVEDTESPVFGGDESVVDDIIPPVDVEDEDSLALEEEEEEEEVVSEDADGVWAAV